MLLSELSPYLYSIRSSTGMVRYLVNEMPKVRDTARHHLLAQS